MLFICPIQQHMLICSTAMYTHKKTSSCANSVQQTCISCSSASHASAGKAAVLIFSLGAEMGKPLKANGRFEAQKRSRAWR